MDIKAAFCYPFQKGNILNTLVYPGIVMTVLLFSLSLVGIIIFLIFLSGAQGIQEFISHPEAQNSNAPVFIMVWGLVMLAAVTVGVLIQILMLGYKWEMLHGFYQEGFTAPAPSWRKQGKAIFISGSKLLLYSIVTGLMIAIPILLIEAIGVMVVLGDKHNAENPFLMVGMVALGLLMLGVGSFFAAPFLIVPVCLGAKTKTLKALFDLPQAIEKTLQHYPSLLMATLWSAGIYVVYTITTMVLNFVPFVGGLLIPFILLLPGLMVHHLYFQVVVGKKSLLKSSDANPVDSLSPDTFSGPETPYPLSPPFKIQEDPLPPPSSQ
ncbi:MAG: DUF4013 domain-containing protein [Cyanobacteria bacterium]|nr:DUF4013 domain-containing protein [Cyanobacteriota bacterium]